MFGVQKMFKDLCTPAQLYLVLSVLSIISVFATSINICNLVVTSAITVAWTYILNRMCQGGYSTISWILVLVPIFGVLGGVLAFLPKLM